MQRGIFLISGISKPSKRIYKLVGERNHMPAISQSPCESDDSAVHAWRYSLWRSGNSLSVLNLRPPNGSRSQVHHIDTFEMNVFKPMSCTVIYLLEALAILLGFAYSLLYVGT